MTINVTKPSVNLREKLNELETNKGLKGNEILQAETAQEVRSLIGAGRKNLIINGGFDVWQRGTSFAASGADIFSSDRWAINSIGGTSRSVSQVFNTDTQSNALRVTLAASGNVQIIQKIEGFKQFHNKSVTISFDVKSTVAATVYVGLRVYHSVGSASIQNSSPTVSATMSRVSVTYNMGDLSSYTEDANSAIRFEIQTGAGVSGEYIEFTNVQLELGSVATDFEHRSYGEELALCQRYYQKIQGSTAVYVATSSTNSSRINGMWATTMRAAPTTATIDTDWTLSAFEDMYQAYNTPGGDHTFPSITADAEL
jgi:hypothetical protein